MTEALFSLSTNKTCFLTSYFLMPPIVRSRRQGQHQNEMMMQQQQKNDNDNDTYHFSATISQIAHINMKQKQSINRDLFSASSVSHSFCAARMSSTLRNLIIN